MISKKQTTTFTLAVCAYQAQDVIRPCMDSIVSQTVQPDSVIVCVHEMDDPTVPVVQTYQERLPQLRIIASHGVGLFQSRNAVLAACDTDYLGFTDADCVLVDTWVEQVKKVLDNRPEIAAGTGRHPPVTHRSFAAWLHHMWFLVETKQTGETDGVIGGNSYFRRKALEAVGGWPDLPGYSNAEDVYISLALQRAGFRIWFEEGAMARHRYEPRFSSLMRKAIAMGKGIVVMMRVTGERGPLWYYTLCIPPLAALALFGLVLLAFTPRIGLVILDLPLLVTLVYLCWKFKSLSLAFPRWIARWILIWPYSVGILKGLICPVPHEVKQP